jgi:REP element-mobilizing transposase RayT
MPRVSRPDYPHQYYHIFNRGFDRKDIFTCKTDYLRFLEKLEESRKRFDWILYGYCLLPNHYHLHVKTGNDSLSTIIHSLQTSHSVYFNRKHKHTSPVFTGRFISILIQKELYHLYLSKYIHLNPVKAGLSQKPQEYPYSSYPEIIGEPRHPYKVIDLRVIKSLTGNATPNALQLYRSFIENNPICEYDPDVVRRDIAGSNRFQSQFE